MQQIVVELSALWLLKHGESRAGPPGAPSYTRPDDGLVWHALCSESSSLRLAVAAVTRFASIDRQPPTPAPLAVKALLMSQLVKLSLKPNMT